VLFYTDGLVETRDRGGAFFPLQDRAAQLSHGDLDHALDSLVHGLSRYAGRELDDDLALVLAEHVGN
jgi:serine phosphatase RsbU (regulator of sigma subunit)